ncbi:MAG: blaR1 3, partial [Phycisphaerales bacterium]|nr:blaR1 3 [Phycisphaerales bacterium]
MEQSRDVATAPAVSGQSPAPSMPREPGARRSTAPTETAVSFREIATGALFVWAAGVLMMLARLARNIGRVARLRRSSRPVQDDRIQKLLHEVAGRLGAREVPALLVSSRTVIPLAVGLGRPAVILPERLLRAINDDELRDVLAHEVAHLLRGDQRTVLLQELAGALYWPIVSVHGLNRELQRAREEVCDNFVLADRDPIRYGETLLHVAELLVKARPMGAAVGIIGGQGELERRIGGLFDPRRNTMTTISRKAACVVMCAFVGICATASATRFAFSAPKDPAAGKVDQAPAGADMERTVILRGKVFGPGDRPVAEARLYLNVDELTDPVEVGTSDAKGSYRVAVPEKKLRRTVSGGFMNDQCKAALLAVAKGVGPGWEELPDVNGGRYGEMKAEYAHDFHLAGDFPIAGRVVDAGGKPVAGVVVAVEKMFDLADPRWRLMHPAIKAGDTNLMTREQTDPNNWFTPLYRTAWKVIGPATTNADGRFQIAGVGGDRAVNLVVNGPGIRTANVSVLTRDDVGDFTKAVRGKYPRTRDPNGYFYPPRKDAANADIGVRLFGPSPTIEVDPARTVSGVVRDAGTGEPIAGVEVKTAGYYGTATTDGQGRYRVMRVEDEASVMLYAQGDQERYLTVVRRLADARGLGEIVADISVPRGVVINGRVLESGTDRPIVSNPRQGCHDVGHGPLVAGYVTYFPLSTNAALRGAPTGLYFEGIPAGKQNYSISAVIGGDGRFRIAVPPGPGVLLVQAAPGFPMFGELMIHKEGEKLHTLFPYVHLKGRARNDGAPAGDAQSLPGFSGPIAISPYHAYRVIDPPADAKSLDVTLDVARAPSRVLRFTDPDGRAIRGVTVQGLVDSPMTVVLDGAEAQALALEPGKPRQMTAISNDGKYAGRTTVGAEDMQPMTIRLEPAASVSGRLLNESTGRPLAGYSVYFAHPGADSAVLQLAEPVKT